MGQAIFRYESGNSGINFLRSYRKIDELLFGFVDCNVLIFVHNLYENHQLSCKYAVEEMLSVCSHIRIKEKIIPLTEESCNNLIERVSDYNEQGFRVLILAERELSTGEVKQWLSVVERKKMTPQGLLTFFNPSKESTAMAIVVLRKNSI
ncbi:hypothetical protein Xbed_00780 [Xenorhabdus beddingii]|uniref:Uncharacterized protein n=1 Tax=Xenorhabdus beddingii TaxID=40578 RepID=A0A1Y2SQ79_9GAMM|nr:hypothetical protein [Xenorhabdus beddingii]OTA21134.1 hypothetical protein Xbed_00780 [Xenorhabdus beddingii]